MCVYIYIHTYIYIYIYICTELEHFRYLALMIFRQYFQELLPSSFATIFRTISVNSKSGRLTDLAFVY